MLKLVYKLVYADGFYRLTEIRGDIPVDTLNIVIDTWKHLNIKAELQEVIWK